MENYGRCKDCKYGKPQESGWKWHCDYYGTLEDPDEVRDCRMFRRRGSEGGCFLTTACCDYKGLPDDCHELSALRNIRDSYIRNKPYGEKMISSYYNEAPLIVEAINASENRELILEDTYQKIKDVVRLIDSGMFDEAVIQYMIMYHDLSKLCL